MDVKESDSKRKLFIGGLPSSITDDSLQAFFGKWGEIENAVVIKDPITNKSKGFGFITYSQSFMVDQAMSNKPHYINDLEVDTKRAVTYDNICEPNTIAANTMFVTGIKEHSKQDLYDYFKKYGNIIEIKILTDKDSGIRKGYGFIKYDNTNSVIKAVLFRIHIVCGEKLIVNKAFNRTGSQSGHGDFDGGSGGINDNYWRRNPQGQQFRFGGDFSVFKTQHFAGQKLVAYKAFDRPDGAGGSQGGYSNLDGGSGGINRNNWGRNPQDQQCGGNYSGTNGAIAGYGQFGKGEGNSCVGVDVGYDGRAGVYNSNYGGAWQGAPQRFGNYDPAWVNQSGCGWDCSQQKYNTMNPNQCEGQPKSYYTSDMHALVYGQSGADHVNECQ